MKKQYFFVANFKSYLTFKEEIKWCSNNVKELAILSQDNKIIICPSFVSMGLVKGIELGAQNCSNFGVGAYTGEISAESLAQLDIKYCLVGHSERRQYFNETNENLEKKIEQLFKNNIVPILCIGESHQEYLTGKTQEVLLAQLNVLKKVSKEIIIAYEPIWAIGTGLTPEVEYIDKIYNFINKLMDNKYKILYGGSVNQDLAQKLKQFTKIDGFLIGKASTSFQEFKKIVLS
ncbi:MAG: triose-phosphate isomerase [Candidatus Babeliales bacterium]|nr:triose-phosphate isomerase [Candidatus Babeliales bacterium]